MKYIVSLNGRQHNVSIDGEERIRLDGELTSPDIRRVGEDAYSVLINGHSVRVVARRIGDVYQVLLASVPYETVVESERDALIRRYSRSTAHESHRKEIRAPMPALVLNLEVATGDSVSAGQGLIVLEAMKMENEMKAPQAGKVKEILVNRGKIVEKGELLLILE